MVTKRTNRSIRVEWTISSDASPQQQYNYSLCAKPSNSSTGSEVSCYTTDENGCNATNLIANTAYNLAVRACYTQSPSVCSNYSDILTNYTKPGSKYTVTFYRLQRLYCKSFGFVTKVRVKETIKLLR